MNGILKITVNKTDENDARGIANAMRAGMYSEVHLKSDENVEMSILLGTRQTLVGERTKLMLAIRGHLKAVGIRSGSFSYILNSFSIFFTPTSFLQAVTYPSHIEL